MSYKVLIVKSNYYKEVANFLIDGATNHLKSKFSSNSKDEDYLEISIIEAPGCFEIPFFIKKNENFFDGFLALGCIIRGETYHFELISNEVTRKIMDLSINLNKPIGFGVLACENIDQALERSNPEIGNKGAEAAIACEKGLLYPNDYY
tara:strand:+ start:2019 stop:2465 length:447 start_codon:yes stop_codon:yes gene_type:complete